MFAKGMEAISALDVRALERTDVSRDPADGSCFYQVDGLAPAEGAGYDVEKSNTTLFDPFVWRRLYLSTFAFPGDHSVEALEGGRFVLHVPVVFRNQLDVGEYPYPFWHSQPQWESYECTGELLFVFEHDAITAVLRSEHQDSSLAQRARLGRAMALGRAHATTSSSNSPKIRCHQPQARSPPRA